MIHFVVKFSFNMAIHVHMMTSLVILHFYAMTFHFHMLVDLSLVIQVIVLSMTTLEKKLEI